MLLKLRTEKINLVFCDVFEEKVKNSEQKSINLHCYEIDHFHNLHHHHLLQVWFPKNFDIPQNLLGNFLILNLKQEK